jgi:hypothetical protein
MKPQDRKVLSFEDIYKRAQALRDSVAKFKVSSAQSKQLLETAPELDAVCNCAAALETAAACLVDSHLDPRCAQCASKQSPSPQAVGCSTLAKAYLKYSIVEALQPHPAYKHDDGYQPLYVVRSMKFDVGRKGRKALAEFRGREIPILQVIAELVDRGIVVQTDFEACNGDVMLGLPEYLPLRGKAHEERIGIVESLAQKYQHVAGWNEDGTGWLMPPRRNYAEIRGSIWDLLSYLHAIELIAGETPRLLN